MSRVIAVQEGQLDMLRNNYKVNVPINTVSISNADVLNSGLTSETVPQMPATPIDMESQTVNLNAFPTQNILDSNVPTPQPVVDMVTTNEVFGTPVSAASLVDNQKVSESASLVSNLPNDLPYNEPVFNSVPTNEVNDNTKDAFVERINQLRNSVSDFSNNINSMLDQMQEEYLSQNAKLANDVANKQAGNPEVQNQPQNDVPLSPFGANVPSGVPNIFDNDKTIVTGANDLLQEIGSARSEYENNQNGMGLVA